MTHRLAAALSAAFLAFPCSAQTATAPTEKPSADKQEPKNKQKGVVVTARKWEELQGDVPQSVTAITEETMRNAGIGGVKAAARYIPNTLVTGFSSRRLSFPFVRGVGSGQGDPAVATFIDGVPQLQISSTNVSFLGLERVEILRGPHSTLYGRNTIGGAINLISKTPSNDYEYEAGGTIGNYGLHAYHFGVSVPIEKDKFYVRVDGMHEARDGYTKNDAPGGGDVDGRDSFFGRAQLLWTPDATSEARLTVHGERSRDGGFVLSDLGGLRNRPNRIYQDFEGDSDRDLFAASFTYRQFDDCCDFTSITGFSDWRIKETSDFDFSIIDGVRRTTKADQTYFTQEFRLASPEDEDIAVAKDVTMRWLVGASGFLSDSHREAANEFRPAGSGIIYFPPTIPGTDRSVGSFESYSLAMFAQSVFTVCEDWEITAALRYEYEDKEAEIKRAFEVGAFSIPTSSSSPDKDFDEFLPRLSISYRCSEELMAYALAARGFKAGGFNLTSPGGSETFGPERSWNYEVGVRATCYDGQLTANLAAFYIEWDDMQLSQFSPTAGGYVVNAGESESRGIELEVRGTPCDDLELFGGLGVLDTEFTRYIDQFGTNVDGESLPFAPELTASFGAQYSTELEYGLRGYARAEIFRVGKFYYDAGNRASADYQLVNFRLGLADSEGGWRLDAWINNAFDDEYVPIAFQPNPANANQFVGESGEPMTYGITLRITF